MRVAYSINDWAWVIYVGVQDIGEHDRNSIRRRLQKLPVEEFEVVKTLINDGWSGTLEDLFIAAKELS